VGVVWIWHGKGAAIALPYTDITALDLVHPGKLQLETFESILARRGGVIRADEPRAPEARHARPFIRRVMVTTHGAAA
jgi:hypothetical protein